jgi:hypothetical protein
MLIFMVRIIRSFTVASLVALALMGCEDTIFPTLREAEPVLVVDAWLTNKPGPQTIRLTRTQPYFENSLPPGVGGATVTVTDQNGVVYPFVETASGVYEWTPSGSEVFGQVGLRYDLSVVFGGETFVAQSRMGRVPAIDSITFFREEATQFADEQYLAEFWSVDPKGPGDAYWIKFFKNGVRMNKPSELITAFDAGFSRGGNFDSANFIVPIRRAINPFDEDPANEGQFLSPYSVGDSVYVEINALTEASFNFLNEVRIQIDRPGGFAELFSTPLANVSTNVANTNANGSKVVGFFNVGAVSGLGRRFTSLSDLSGE